MKILVFVGSPRSNGNTYALSKVFKDLLDKFGIESDFVYSNDGVYQPCRSCYYCSTHHNSCSIKDDMVPYINNSDTYSAMVFMTPIYFFGFSAQSKIFIDRMGACGWENKIIALITSSGSAGKMGGNDILVKSLKRTCVYNKCKFAGFYNKVTGDEVLPVTSEDIEGLKRVIINIQNMG